MYTNHAAHVSCSLHGYKAGSLQLLCFGLPAVLHLLACLLYWRPFAYLQVFQLPKALAYPLFYKLVAPNSSSVTRDAILSWFDEKNVIQVG